MALIYLAFVLSAVSVATSEVITHSAVDSNGTCNCLSNITIQIESPRESQSLLVEQLIVENERMKVKLQALKQNRSSEESSREFPADIYSYAVLELTF